MICDTDTPTSNTQPTHTFIPLPSTSHPPHRSIKITLIGDSYSGKTSILSALCDIPRDSLPSATIGIDLYFKYINNPPNPPVKVQLWDTAGHERFRMISTSYYRNAQGVVLVADPTQPTFWENTDAWLEQIDTFIHPDACLLLLVHKMDCLSDQQQHTLKQSCIRRWFGRHIFFTSTRATRTTLTTHSTHSTTNAIDQAFSFLIDTIQKRPFEPVPTFCVPLHTNHNQLHAVDNPNTNSNTNPITPNSSSNSTHETSQYAMDDANISAFSCISCISCICMTCSCPWLSCP
jgi:small GTP-binding protein